MSKMNGTKRKRVTVSLKEYHPDQNYVTNNAYKEECKNALDRCFVKVCDKAYKTMREPKHDLTALTLDDSDLEVPLY